MMPKYRYRYYRVSNMQTGLHEIREARKGERNFWGKTYYDKDELEKIIAAYNTIKKK